MIDTKILDEILPLPDQDELKAELVQELSGANFAITSFAAGGVFNTMLMIVIRVYLELVSLLRRTLNNSFAGHAEGIWLELKAADFGKVRKDAVKAQGKVTLSRTADGDAIKVYKGHVFKTTKDINGDELRYFALQDAVLQRGYLETDVLVEAEKAGARYNVPVGQITRSLTYIEGVDAVTNKDGWITLEGSDQEEIESLRGRVLKSWAELSTKPTRDKLQNQCEAIPGVLFVRIDDNHPRGQGTTDIIVTGSAGAATEALLEQVRAVADKIKGTYDNILVKSSETVAQNVTVTVTIPDSVTGDGLEDQVTAVITELLRIRRNRNLNELTHADIIYAIKRDIPSIRNVRVTEPAADVALESDKVILLGTVAVTVQRE